MGEIRLGGLPRTRRWEQVVYLIEHGGDAASIAGAALWAAENGFSQAADDEGLAQTTWLLAQLPHAARTPAYVERLNALGLGVSEAPRVLDLIGGLIDAIDIRVRRAGGRTDLGEMAQMAAAETLTATLVERRRSLLGPTPEDVRRVLAALMSRERFGGFARDYFARVTRRFLNFYLGCELSKHVGGDRRFKNVAEHTEFNAALERHCLECAESVEEFAGGWFAQANWGRGISPEDAGNFAWGALQRLRSVLSKGVDEP